MPYVTNADVRNALAPDGANDESTAAQMSNAAIDRAILDAQAEVDGHLRDRYAAPLANPPQLVKSITADIAAYLATLTHARNSALPENHPVWLRYSRASALLERLGSGAMDLEDEPASEALPIEPVVVNPRSHDLFAEGETLGPIPVWLR